MTNTVLDTQIDANNVFFVLFKKASYYVYTRSVRHNDILLQRRVNRDVRDGVMLAPPSVQSNYFARLVYPLLESVLDSTSRAIRGIVSRAQVRAGVI